MADRINMKAWNRKNRMALVEHLEMYVSAGLDISQALELSKKGMSKKAADSLERARSSVESGRTLSAALDREAGLPPAVSGVIDCGESSGNLAQSLKIAHALLEREDELIKKCLSAMTYPTIIGLAATAMVIALMRGVMPQIIPLLTSLHGDLPVLTKIAIWASEALIEWGIYGAIGSALITASAIIIYKRSAPARSLAHAIVLGIPIVGSLISWYAFALFFRSAGALVESGMPADEAYDKSASAMNVLPLRRSLCGKAESLRRGACMSDAVSGDVPQYAVSLIAAGEASGNLAQSLSRASALLDRELDHALKRLTSLVEPVMMMGVGGMVGAIALSIMMPIYGISKTLQH